VKIKGKNKKIERNQEELILICNERKKVLGV